MRRTGSSAPWRSKDGAGGWCGSRWWTGYRRPGWPRRSGRRPMTDPTRSALRAPRSARQVLIATRSAGKAREIRALFAGSPFTPVFPDDLGLVPAPAEASLESGATYAAHALAKARYFAGRSDLPTAADDSGIEVDALGGAPGVHSARWAGERGTAGGEQDVERVNNALLLERLHGVPAERRTARYRC